MNQTWVAGGVFLITYAFVVSERVHRTLAALAGGLLMMLLGVLTQAEAFAAVDWNVIFLLVGMMSIAAVLRSTGLFQWVAVQAVKLGGGRPFRILLMLSLITAFTSAFLDNVTIVVLVVPVTLFVAASLHISPMPFLIAEILACNIGGTATLIGDPPNILIASAADIDFVTFLAHMAPISLLILACFVALAWFLFRQELSRAPVDGLDVQALDTSQLITDRKLLRKALIVTAAVLLGFLLQGITGLEPATIAMVGATALLLWGKCDPHAVLRDVEWTTLFFFLGLFIVVEGVARVGLIEDAAHAALRATGGNLPLTAMSLLWLSAAFSGIIDNIPYTATMIPLVRSLGQSMPVQTLWWCLALGACLGGNATLVGASANVVVANLADRSGIPLTFGVFLRYGLITTLMSLVLSSLYIWLRYL